MSLECKQTNICANMLWLNPKKPYLLTWLWQRFCYRKRQKRLMVIRNDTICLSLSFSFLLLSFLVSFHKHFMRLIWNNFCSSRRGFIRLSENRVCEQKASAVQRSMHLSKEIFEIPNKEMQSAGEWDIFQIDFYYWRYILRYVALTMIS